MLRFTMEMKFGMDVSENFMENEMSFNDAVINGEVKLGDLDFKVIDPDGNELELDGLDNSELLSMFTNSLNEKARAE